MQIGMAAKELVVYPDALPHWEKEGRIEPAERTAGGRGKIAKRYVHTLDLAPASEKESPRCEIGRAKVPPWDD